MISTVVDITRTISMNMDIARMGATDRRLRGQQDGGAGARDELRVGRPRNRRHAHVPHGHVQGLDEGASDPAPVTAPGEYTLMTIRSHDQYNTTLYGHIVQTGRSSSRGSTTRKSVPAFGGRRARVLRGDGPVGHADQHTRLRDATRGGLGGVTKFV